MDGKWHGALCGCRNDLPAARLRLRARVRAPAGKPVWLHGIAGRDSAGGRGAAIAAREFLRRSLKMPVKGTTFVVQVRERVYVGGGADACLCMRVCVWLGEGFIEGVGVGCGTRAPPSAPPLPLPHPIHRPPHPHFAPAAPHMSLTLSPCLPAPCPLPAPRPGPPWPCGGHRQGFGKLGSWAAQILSKEMGGKASASATGLV